MLLSLRMVDKRVTGQGRWVKQECARQDEAAERLFPARCGLWPLQAVSPEQTHLLQTLPGEPHALLMIDCPSWGFPGSSCSMLGSCSLGGEQGVFFAVFPQELLRSCLNGRWTWLPAACVCPPTDSCLWQGAPKTLTWLCHLEHCTPLPERSCPPCSKARLVKPTQGRRIVWTAPSDCRDTQNQLALGNAGVLSCAGWMFPCMIPHLLAAGMVPSSLGLGSCSECCSLSCV